MFLQLYTFHLLLFHFMKNIISYHKKYGDNNNYLIVSENELVYRLK